MRLKISIAPFTYLLLSIFCCSHSLSQNELAHLLTRAPRSTSQLSNTLSAINSSAINSTAINSVGREIPNFVLPNTKNQMVSLGDQVQYRYLVVVFMGTACPIANAYVPDLIKLKKMYADESIQFIGINPNLTDSMEDVAKHKAEYGINFPVLKDKEQLTVDLFGATRTPEVFVLDRRRNIRYQGRIDDRIGYDYKRAKARRSDLQEAIDELINQKPVTVEYTKTLGCLFTRKSSLFKTGEVTYAKQVSRIIENRCANCHHQGTVAPHSLTSYDEIRQRSEMIREVVTTQRMPPWDADPRHGEFSNDLRMTPKEIQTLVAWIDDGAPFGDKKDLGTPKQFVDNWRIPKPDFVFEMPVEYTVPADGVVEYQYFDTPTNFKEDVWVQAAEARPGNGAVVHHIIGFVQPKGVKFHEGLPAVAGYAPGEEPMIYPNGMGFKIPAGANIHWQVHYTPTGKIEKDRSKIGIVVCKDIPKQQVIQDITINNWFEIQPGAERQKEVAQRKLPEPVELISLMPHMHVRGASFKYMAYPPNGKPITLLDVPFYDFNWQHRYRFKKPIRLEKGTVIKSIAHFDNSLDNPANPDPKKLVKWGDQTSDEMMIGYFNYVRPKDVKLRKNP